MNRLPPSLLYLVVYNPTLLPEDQIKAEDEDAEEQAHVLFYTANDHAVSKDRVLRQVGLAKALVNFTTMFDAQAQCEAVHSQSRRMVMISPEPNYWIHACVELEKSLRPPKKDEKGKVKQQEPVYDYNECSLHDAALRSLLQLGYEAFKITHGSFTSILSKLGREALELQLERFFTVWAWSLDFGKEMPFSDYLGVRVHPLSNQLIPLVETLEDHLPPHYFPLILVSPCVIASRASTIPIPPGLIRRLLSLIPIPPHMSRSNSTKENSVKEDETTQSEPKAAENKTGTVTKKFLGIPGIPAPNMNVNMDVRKWSWRPYLTFGMSGSTSDAKGTSPPEGEQKDVENPNGSVARDNPSAEEAVKVDSQALEDALSSETPPHGVATSEPMVAGDGIKPPSQEKLVPTPEDSQPSSGELPTTEKHEDNQASEAVSAGKEVTLAPKPPVPFMETHIHFSSDDPLDTHLRIIRYLRHNNLLLALIPLTETDDTLLDSELAERCMELLERVQETITVEQEKIATAFSSSPVQSVFQRSQHVITTPSHLNYTSTTFTAASWHLHDGRRTLEIDEDVLEIFSRGQSPADWHLVKRGLGTDERGLNSMQGDVYMEIARKEASLTDVDNEIAGVIRRFLE